jgi:hypothetical protein
MIIGLAVSAVSTVAGLGLGFGAGRVKNSGKLAAVKAELVKAETSAVAEVKSLVAAIRAKL